MTNTNTWGQHLWDKTEEVFLQAGQETGLLSGHYTKFYKELGDIEKDYAKSLRKLCNKFLTKQEGGSQELTREKGFRLFLTELGYKAGQHEVLAELYSKSLPEELKNKVKDQTKNIEKLRKELKRSQETTEQVQKSHEKYKTKYQKSYQDAVNAERCWQKAESDCSFSRKEVEKYRTVSVEKQKQCEENRRILEHQRENLQQASSDHLHRALPSVLDSLQQISIDTGDFLCHTMQRGVLAECDSQKVIASCNSEMQKIVEAVSPLEDTERVIEFYKSGAVCSLDTLDHALVDLSQVKHNFNTIRKYKSNTKISSSTSDKDCQSLYQLKRKIQSKINALEDEIVKGRKEMSGLQLMIESYTKNPSYGDVNKFRGELDKVTHKVQVLESDLFSLNTELAEIVKKLGPDTAEAGLDQTGETLSLCGSDSRSETQSQSSGYPSSASSLEVTEVESQYGSVGSYRSTIQSLLNTSPALYLPASTQDQEEDEEEDLPLPPPPPSLLVEEVEEVEEVEVVTALYQFDVMTEGNIPLTEGEQVYRLGPDEEGWMKVRRLDGSEEGFVPTSFLRI